MKNTFTLRVYWLAFILRLIPVLLTANLGIGLDDMFQYDMLARSIASGNGFRWYAQPDLEKLKPFVEFDLSTAKNYDPTVGLPTSFRAPLYPAFLAIVYSFSGLGFTRFFFARLAQVIFLGAPLAPLTYFIAQKIPFTNSLSPAQQEKIAKIAAGCVAVYPILLLYPLGLGTENLFFVLLLLSFLFLLKTLQRPSRQNFILAGVLLGLTALTRSIILIFAGALIVYFFYLFKRKTLWFGLALLLAVASWSLRNSLLHGKPTGIETSMGYNLYLGYHPQGDGAFVFGPSLDLLPILDDAQRDEVGTGQALAFIRAQPERFLPLMVNRLGYFFGLEKRALIYFYSNNLFGYLPSPLLIPLALIFFLPFVLLSLSAVWGLLGLKASPPTHLIWMLFAAYTLPHILILSEDRFHLAFIPFFAILAAAAWVIRFEAQPDFWAMFNKHQQKLWWGLFINGLMLFNWAYEIWRAAEKLAALLGPEGNKTFLPY